MKMNYRYLYWAIPAAVLIAIAVTLVLNRHLEGRLEIRLSADFLRRHGDSFPSMGHISGVRYDRSSAAQVSFKRGRVEGIYPFMLQSQEGDVAVRVYWMNSRDGDAFSVWRVEKLNHGAKPTVIWPTER